VEFSVSKVRKVNIGGTEVNVFDQPVVTGPTDGVEFPGFAVRAIGTANVGDMCRCGAARLTNIVSEQEPEAENRMVVVKCYSCKGHFLAPYPYTGGAQDGK